jgi:hypothetical protein
MMSSPLLNGENRKEIATLHFNSVQEIDVRALRAMLQEAILLDEACAAQRRKA